MVKLDAKTLLDALTAEIGLAQAEVEASHAAAQAGLEGEVAGYVKRVTDHARACGVYEGLVGAVGVLNEQVRAVGREVANG